MNDWGPSTYGRPCRECAFEWTLTLDVVAPTMTALAAAYGDLLRGATGREQHPDLSWCSSAYVSHVADNLRIWTERLRGVALGAPRRVGSYDESGLAVARNYETIPLQAAMWSLQLSVAEWLKAIGSAPPKGTVLVHPERGEMDLLDVVTANTHDAHHHLWDIARTLQWET